jgi:hypothetical protein
LVSRAAPDVIDLSESAQPLLRVENTGILVGRTRAECYRDHPPAAIAKNAAKLEELGVLGYLQ